MRSPELPKPGEKIFEFASALKVVSPTEVLVGRRGQPESEWCRLNLEGIEPTLAATIVFLLMFQVDARHMLYVNDFFAWLRAFAYEDQSELINASVISFQEVYDRSSLASHNISIDRFKNQFVLVFSLFSNPSFLSRILVLPSDPRLINGVQRIMGSEQPLERTVWLFDHYSSWRSAVFNLAMKGRGQLVNKKLTKLAVLKQEVSDYLVSISPEIEVLAKQIIETLAMPKDLLDEVTNVVKREVNSGLEFALALKFPLECELESLSYWPFSHYGNPEMAAAGKTIPSLGPVDLKINACASPACPARGLITRIR